MAFQYDRDSDRGTAYGTDVDTAYGVDQDRGPASTAVPGQDGPREDLSPDDFGPESVEPEGATNPATGAEYGEVSG